jgi:hypothetical protein
MDRPAWARGSALAPWGFALGTLAVLVLTRGAPMPVGVFYDDGIYFDLSRALASGAGYHHLALPGAPAGVHYPPLYPVWLVVWGWLSPPADTMTIAGWLTAGNALLAAASVVPWARWGARRVGLGWTAGIAAAAAVLLVPARAVTGTLFSEPLAWLLLGLTFDLADDSGDAAPLSRGRAIAAAVVAAMLPLARTILLPVTIAVVWRLASDPEKKAAERQRDAALAAFMLLPAVAWFAWTRQHAHEIPAAWTMSYGSYGGMWRESIHGAGDLAALVWHQVRGVFSIARVVWGRQGVLIGLALAGFGLWQLRGWRSVALISTVGYFAAVMIWPVSPDRFVWGMLPLLALLMAGGALAVARLLPPRIPRSAVAIVVLSIPVTTCGIINVRGYRAEGWIVPQRREALSYRAAVRWSATLPRDAVVLTANDPLFAQWTGLHAAPLLAPDLRDPPLHSAVERATASACAVGAGWMVVTDTLDEAAQAIASIRADPGAVELGETVHLDGGGAAVQFLCYGKW